MKKTLLSLLLIGSIFTAKAGTTNNIEKIDTLSYITGQQIAHTIEEDIVPKLRLDYDMIVSTFKKSYSSDKSIKVEGVTINQETLQELTNKYLTYELQEKVIAAMDDETIQVFNPKDKKIVSALVGADFAYSVKKAPFDIEKKSLMKAFTDTKEKKELLSAEQANDYMEYYYTVVIPEKNKKESEEWLAKTSKKKGVKKTESGICYKIEAAGDMNIKATKDNDVVKVLYTGTTKDGKVFDSNRWADMPKERQEMIKNYLPEQAGKDSPIEFPLNKVIKGWTEGMKLIGKGGKITLWIPAEHAYGERGAGNDIGPNEALRFDVELLDVTNK